MSKNFELLQSVGKEHEMLQAEAEIAAEPRPARVYAAAIEEPVAEVSEPIAAGPSKFSPQELDEVGKLVQRVFLLPGAEAPRSVVFTSVESGSGCSWMCARAAEALARHSNASVCVVDANLRNPGLHLHFDVDNPHGLAEALSYSDSIRRFARPLSQNLWLLSAGNPGENSQALIGADRIRLRLGELQSEFDFVLVDVACLGKANDALTLGSAAEGVVLVLKANSSRRETARKAVQDLQAAKARVLGAVLNQRTFPIPQAIYEKL
ncbi:MAG TPA: CpsD/CapB family tyrosine-protein kinase [Dongiaceae bacterium]|nr:CpsD/CapB family tyrosine-protein kinase [Dongiaceae bacterium]